MPIFQNQRKSAESASSAFYSGSENIFFKHVLKETVWIKTGFFHTLNIV